VLWQGPSALALGGLLLAGWLCWSLSEYLLHRWVFHYLGPKGWQRRFHFVAHGVHHDYPSDRGRLLMPLGISIPVGFSFFLLMAALAPFATACTLFVGFGIGYLGYDGTHYFTHHFKARSRLGKFLKRYHLVHHHTGVDGLYGVSSPLWDYVFGSHEDLRESRPRAAAKRAATSS
jgi:sterol desaturase/sphingolipid hydroxylase (fatty acid hydroxylase superfamily)